MTFQDTPMWLVTNRPDYAPDSSDSEEDVEFGLQQRRSAAAAAAALPVVTTEAEKEDRRLKRLQERKVEAEGDSSEDEDRYSDCIQMSAHICLLLSVCTATQTPH